MKLCILYGFAEGPTIGKRFQRACVEAGYAIVRDPSAADIIFAHSGGCFLVQSDKPVLMVGVPWYPGRPLFVSIVLKVAQELRFVQQAHFRKLLQNLRYALNLKRDWYILHNRSLSRPWNSEHAITIVRNDHDTYCSPNIEQAPWKGPRKFVVLPGEHDDCWLHPEPYINLLQSQVVEE